MNIDTDSIAAVILCGGLSTRMGTDKGLKEAQGIPWAQQLRDRLFGLGIKTFLSVRPEQRSVYALRMPGLSLIEDENFTNINGPLRGLLSAHLYLPEHHWLIVPCDMPHLSEEIFSSWIAEFQRQQLPLEAVISQTEQRLQPICGIYSQKGLSVLNSHYLQGQLANKSMNAIVKNYLSAYVMEISSDKVSQYKNLNSPHDGI